MTRPKLYMLIGTPYSGKSTFVKEEIASLAAGDYPVPVVIDSDSILVDMAEKANISYNQSFLLNHKKASKEMFRRAEAAVKTDKDIYWDQTNMTRKARARKLIMVPDHYEKIALVFPQVSAEELARRTALRTDKVIRQYIIDDMIASYERPELNEGFDKIVDM
jgi:predicted kinase